MKLNDREHPSTRTPVPRGADAAREALRQRVQRTPLQRRVAALINRLDYGVVRTVDELQAVRRHRHREYVGSGAIEPQAGGMLEDENDSGPATRIYTAWLEGELAGSIRLSVLRGHHREGLTIRCFPEIVEPMLEGGATLIDPNRLTTASTLSRSEPVLIFGVLRLATLAARHYGAEHCLAPIRPHHASFYRRFLHATRLSEARLFPGTNVAMELYDVHVPSARRAAGGENPFLLEHDGECEALFPSLAELHGELEPREVG